MVTNYRRTCASCTHGWTSRGRLRTAPGGLDGLRHVMKLGALMVRVMVPLVATLWCFALGLATSALADPDDWVDSVCKPLPLLPGPPALQNATRSAMCSSWDSLVLTIGQYARPSDLDRDIRIYREGTPVAVKKDSDGSTWIFIAKKLNTLRPLEAHGFKIISL